MVTATLSPQKTVIHLISQIQCEDIRRAREQRESSRQNISLPVTIKSLDGEHVCSAVSRDISSLGIGLITTEAVEPCSIHELELQLANSTNSIVAECVWCHRFGKGFFLSGWRFV